MANGYKARAVFPFAAGEDVPALAEVLRGGEPAHVLLHEASHAPAPAHIAEVLRASWTLVSVAAE